MTLFDLDLIPKLTIGPFASNPREEQTRDQIKEFAVCDVRGGPNNSAIRYIV